jgi:hypothetical protein
MVIRSPLAAGITKVNAQSHDAPSVVRTLQCVIRQQYLHTNQPPIDLISGRWSSQSPANFILVFNGQVDNAVVMRHRQVILDLFGSDATITPQKGYSHILLHMVPVVRDGNGALPGPDELRSELGRNMLCSGITLFSNPRWLKADIPADARHGSITFAFLDEDGKTTSCILQSPLFMFGGAVHSQRFQLLPLIQQCTRCWALGHPTLRCRHPKDAIICCICGKKHLSKEHQFLCSSSNKHDSLKCNCVCKCINCTCEKLPATGHISTDHSCPLCACYRKVNGVERRTGITTDEETPALNLMAAGDASDDPIDVTDA